MHRLPLLAAIVGLVWCGILPGLASFTPQDDVDCAGAPDDLVVVGRLVGQSQHSIVHRGERMTVRVDRYVVDEVERGRWDVREIELEARGHVSPIRRHRLFIDLDPVNEGVPVRDRLGAGLTSHDRCGGSHELGFVWPTNLSALRWLTGCTWVVVVSIVVLITFASNRGVRRAKRRLAHIDVSIERGEVAS